MCGLYNHKCVTTTQIVEIMSKFVTRAYSLSPHLLNLYVQDALDQIREEIWVRIKVNRKRMLMLRFADGKAVLTDSGDELQRVLNIHKDNGRL